MKIFNNLSFPKTIFLITFIYGIVISLLFSVWWTAYAEETATSTPETAITTATTTPESPILSTATSTPENSTSTISVIATSSPETIFVIPLPPIPESLPLPPLPETPAPTPSPAPEPEPEPQQSKTPDPAIAPSTVSITIFTPDGAAPTIPVFVSFVGVAGKTFGGTINREGNLTITMPQGRYYTEILVIDTKYGPPQSTPSFFLGAGEEQVFGPLLLSKKSSFADPVLETEIAATIKNEGGGFSKIFSLIVKLLLAILNEIRSLRSELISN